jgi:hypothetical protein
MCFGGGGDSKQTTTTKNKPYDKRLPEEQGGLDMSSEIMQQMLGSMGYDVKSTSRRDSIGSEFRSQIDALKPQREAAASEQAGLSENIANLTAQLRTAPRDQRATIQKQIKDSKTQLGGVNKQLGAFDADIGGFQKQLDASLAGFDKDLKAGRTSENVRSISKRQLTPEEQARMDREQKIVDSSENMLAGGDLSPELQAKLGTIYDERRRQGNEELKRFGVEAAGARGMEMTDSPIFNPLMREKANMESQLGASQAQSYLSMRSEELARAQGLREFQEGLKQRRTFDNPMGMYNAAADLALRLYGPRFGVQSGSSVTTGGGNPTANFGMAAQGAGGLMQGVGAVGKLFG